ncbi:MAG: hypothetical protein ACI93R_002225 [Flavobacteriales bacterium]|jgi:hypothetical protein
MNCNSVVEKFDEYNDEMLSPLEQKSVCQHLSTCKCCASAYAEFQHEHRSYLALLAKAAPQEMGSGRAIQLLRVAKTRVENEKTRHKTLHVNTPFLQGFAAAIALVAVVFVFSFMQNDGDPEVIPAGIVQTGTFHDVNVVIFVPNDMPGAELKLQLPDNMVLEGSPDMRTIVWTSDLLAGANQLVLPVFVAPDTDLNVQQSIAATIGYNDKTRTFELRVNLNAVRNRDQGAITLPISSFKISA